jgi:hypothetical protein
MTVLLTFLTLAGVQDQDPVSSALASLDNQPQEVFTENATALLVPTGQQKNLVKTILIDVPELPFGTALEIEVTDTAKYYTSVGLQVRSRAVLNEGDIVFLSLYTKCIETENDIKMGLLEASIGSYRTGYALPRPPQSYSCSMSRRPAERDAVRTGAFAVEVANS